MRSFISRLAFSVNSVGGIHGTSRWQSAEIRLYFILGPLLAGSLSSATGVVGVSLEPKRWRSNRATVSGARHIRPRQTDLRLTTGVIRLRADRRIFPRIIILSHFPISGVARNRTTLGLLALVLLT